MKSETIKFKIIDFQDDRIWLHSKIRGYGMWIYNDELERLFRIKENK